MARNPKNRLERWEVAIIKAMMATPTRKNDQDILAYFTRPTRSINHGRIKDIRDGRRQKASKEMLWRGGEDIASIVADVNRWSTCVYRQLKRGRSGDEVRPGWRVN
jgi:hypothetical protein